MSTSIYEVLDELDGQATRRPTKGSKLERLMAQFLRTDPVYAEQFSEVWLWQDWPGRGGKHDTGIDIVAVDRLTGGNVAIQCKFFDPNSTISRPTSTPSSPRRARRGSPAGSSCRRRTSGTPTPRTRSRASRSRSGASGSR